MTVQTLEVCHCILRGGSVSPIQRQVYLLCRYYYMYQWIFGSFIRIVPTGSPNTVLMVHTLARPLHSSTVPLRPCLYLSVNPTVDLKLKLPEETNGQWQYIHVCKSGREKPFIVVSTQLAMSMIASPIVIYLNIQCARYLYALLVYLI